MTDPPQYRKCFYRAAFILLALAMGYVVLQPSYNFAHWIPHTLLRDIGISYPALLAFETHADKALHLFGAFLLSISLYRSQLPLLSQHRLYPFIAIFMASAGAELIQWSIGRGIEVNDLLVSALGCLLAYRATTD